MNDLSEKFLRCPNCNSYSVEATKLNFKEWLGSMFVPVQAHNCTNCSFRYVKFGKFSNNSLGKKFFLVLPILLLGVIFAATQFLSGPQGLGVVSNDGKHDDPPISADETKISAKSAGHNPEPVQATSDKKITEIILRSNPKFGVNWESMEQGLKITRLSDGPLKQAGLKPGDVILSVNNIILINEDLLLKIRDKVFDGKLAKAELKVLREFDELNFKLVKARQESPDSSLKPPAKEEQPKSAQTAQYFVKVFAATTIKTRSSHPSSEDRSFRWHFKTKEVTIFRSEEQKVFISGDATGQKNWAVDDKLIINNTTFDGLKKAYTRVTSYLPKAVLQEPLEITSLVPADRDVSLKVQLADHGIYWGNTDIFIVIK